MRDLEAASTLSSKLFNEVRQSRKNQVTWYPATSGVTILPAYTISFSAELGDRLSSCQNFGRGRLKIKMLIAALLACHWCCGNAVCQCDHTKPFVTGFTHRRFNTTICHKTCQCHCFNTKLFKVLLQICVGKSAGAMFAHDNYILGLWC